MQKRLYCCYKLDISKYSHYHLKGQVTIIGETVEDFKDRLDNLVKRLQDNNLASHLGYKSRWEVNSPQSFQLSFQISFCVFERSFLRAKLLYIIMFQVQVSLQVRFISRLVKNCYLYFTHRFTNLTHFVAMNEIIHLFEQSASSLYILSMMWDICENRCISWQTFCTSKFFEISNHPYCLVVILMKRQESQE